MNKTINTTEWAGVLKSMPLEMRFRYCRFMSGLTIAQVAKKIGGSTTTVCRSESEDHVGVLSLGTVIRLANCYAVPMEVLFAGAKL